jgi:hypothetical protein
MLSGACPLFTAGALRCYEMTTGDIPRLQRFFEANPECHIAVTGDSPKPDAAREELESLPPAAWSRGKKWLLEFVDDDGSMVAMADVIADLFVDGVWHIGLFIVATSLHGGGTAYVSYQNLESWMRRGGARWSRLGVVVGNARAERFWNSVGYAQVRTRDGVQLGNRVATVRVMAKPLAKGNLSEYLAFGRARSPGVAMMSRTGR